MSGSTDDAEHYMRLALAEAKKSPPKPTNYCVGAVLVDEPEKQILATGYTLEMPGNTHAEQSCFQKLAKEHSVPEEQVGNVLPKGTVIYTTMEPCSERLSGNAPCVSRILATRTGSNGGIQKVYVGVQEPEKFIGSNVGKAKLEEAGIEYIHVKGLEDEILKVATSGHEKDQ